LVAAHKEAAAPSLGLKNTALKKGQKTRRGKMGGGGTNGSGGIE
jgi:hypothetical protein